VSDDCYNDLYRNKILTQLMDDKITFSEASDILGVSRSVLDDMLNNFDYQLPLEKLNQVSQQEKDNLLAIKKMIENEG
jgi:hypothetical protein